MRPVTKLKKYNLKGKEVGQCVVDESLLTAEAPAQLVKDYITALRANQRQWSSCTKTRAEVNHTTKKPHRQKGTGRARQGSFVAPHFRGGGIAFGPRPKFDQNVKLNRKEKRAVIRFLLAEKIRNNRVILLDSTELKVPKTKDIASFLEERELTKKILFVGEAPIPVKGDETKEAETAVRKTVGNHQHANFQKSVRNLPIAEFALVSHLNGYDLINAADLVLTEKAFEECTKWLA